MASVGLINNYWEQKYGGPAPDSVHQALANVDENTARARMESGEFDYGAGGDIISAIAGPIFQELRAFEERTKQFGLEGPFAFDEAQARTASQEIADPYYDQLVNEFTKGVELKRKQGAEQEREVLSSLTREKEYETGNLRQQIEDAIKTTEEGYATAGLYESGLRRQAAGRQGVLGERALTNQANVFSERQAATERQQRQLGEQLDYTTEFGLPKLGRERKEAVEAGVEARRREAQQQTEVERLQVTALPFVRQSEEALQRLLQFQ